MDVICVQEPASYPGTKTQNHLGYDCYAPVDSWDSTDPEQREAKRPHIMTYIRKGAGLRTQQRRPIHEVLPSIPLARPFRVDGIDEQFLVHEGRVEAVVPFSIDASPGDLTLAVTVDYQACSAVDCFPPAQLRLELPLAGLDLIRD